MSDFNIFRNISELSDRQLQTHDFSQEKNLVKADDIENLLKKDGLFSIDNKGRITVVNAGKRDNVIFRFFKGLFNREYRLEQHSIDRGHILKKNASFNKLLRDACINYAVSKHDKGEINSDQNRLISERIIGLYDTRKEVTTGTIKSAIRHDYNFTSPINSGIGLAQCENTRGILVKGENLSPLDFIKKYSDSGNKLTNESLATSILIKAAKNPHSFSYIGKANDANVIRSLLYKPTLNPKEQTQFRAAMLSIMSEIKNRMVNTVENALEKGKDLKDVANYLKEVFSQFSDKNAKTPSEVDTQLSYLFEQINGFVSTDVQKANDVNAYKKIDDNDKTGVALATSKLKTALPSLNDRQLAQIVAFLPRNDEGQIKEKAIDSYISNINKGYAEFKSAMNELTHAMIHEQQEDINNAYQALGKVFDKLFDKVEGRDELAPVAGNLVHYMSITESPDFLDKIDFEKLGQYYDSAHNVIDHLPTELSGDQAHIDVINKENITLSFVETVFEQIGFMVKVNKTGDPRLVASEDDRLKSNCDKAFNGVVQTNLMESPVFKQQVQSAVNAFPENIREIIGPFMMDTVKGALQDIEFTSIDDFQKNVGELCNKYKDVLLNHKQFMDMLNKSSYTVDNLNKFTANCVKLISKEFAEDKKINNFGEDGVNTTFVHDVGRNAIYDFNGVDFQKDIKQKDAVGSFKQMLKDNHVDDSFIPFITFYMSQSGLSYLIQSDLAHQGSNYINPSLPSSDELFEAGITPTNGNYHNDIKIENGIMTITTDFRVSVRFQDSTYVPTNHMPDDGNVDVQTMRFHMQIDLNQGVDENGIPKGITFLNSEVGTEFKEE